MARKQKRELIDEEALLRSAARVSVAEWIAGTVSAILLVAMIGFLLYEAVSNDIAVPALSAHIDRVEAIGGRHVVVFRAVNDGDATAAAVKVEGRLTSGGRTVETSEVVLDYVPARSERAGGLVFSRDPASHDLGIRIVGYAEP